VQGPGDLPGDYRDLLAAVADAREPVRCKQLCEQLGLGTEPKHVEGARSKLKRLVDRGWLRRNGAGMFTAVP
jgi:predicted ArsR family transcriptional regulator